MYPSLPPHQLEKLRAIRLLVMDVDGVLTDGRLSFTHEHFEIKSFSILDGLGLKLLMNSGIQTAIITGRSSPQVLARAESLGIHHVQQGREDKLTALTELWDKTGFNATNTAYIGDDLPDLKAIKAVKFGASVPNGYWRVREAADWVSQSAGGQGAVRELCDLLLEAQGKLQSTLDQYE